MSHPYGPPPQQPGQPHQPYGSQPQPYGAPQQPYGAPQQPYGQVPPPGYGPVVVPGARSYTAGKPPPYALPADPNAIGNYRGWVVAALVLSLGTGILALVRSREVDEYKAQGNVVLAKEASDSVRVLCLFATFQGILLWAAIIVCLVIFVF